MPGKKKAADVGKMVDAQAKGKASKGGTDRNPSATGELDERTSKVRVQRIE
jgi:hypothetical protein